MCCSAFSCKAFSEQVCAGLNWVGVEDGEGEQKTSVALQAFLINDTFTVSPNIYTEIAGETLFWGLHENELIVVSPAINIWYRTNLSVYIFITLKNII